MGYDFHEKMRQHEHEFYTWLVGVHRTEVRAYRHMVWSWWFAVTSQFAAGGWSLLGGRYLYASVNAVLFALLMALRTRHRPPSPLPPPPAGWEPPPTVQVRLRGE